MKKYEYMVNYVFPGGCGRMFLTREKKIGSIKDVEGIDEFLRSDKFNTDLPKSLKEKIYINDFKLLRTYRKED